MWDNDFLIYLFKFNDVKGIIKLIQICKNFKEIIKNNNLFEIQVNIYYHKLCIMNQYFFKDKLCKNSNIELLKHLIDNNLILFNNEHFLICGKNKKFDMAKLIHQKYNISLFEVKIWNQIKQLSNFTYRILLAVDNNQLQEFDDLLGIFEGLKDLTENLVDDKKYILSYICERSKKDKTFEQFIKVFTNKKILNCDLIETNNKLS